MDKLAGLHIGRNPRRVEPEQAISSLHFILMNDFYGFVVHGAKIPASVRRLGAMVKSDHESLKTFWHDAPHRVYNVGDMEDKRNGIQKKSE